MEIRELKHTELDDLLNLYGHMHEEDDPLPERPLVEAVWRDIQAGSRHSCLGVFVEGKLVSACTLSVIPNLSRGCRPYGLVENVVTHRAFRNKGYGSQVVKYALKLAWRENCYKVMLLTGRKDEKVYRFYESLGFERNAKQAFLAKP
jgi:GNAT superfamily N-acetyltransferase